MRSCALVLLLHLLVVLCPAAAAETGHWTLFLYLVGDESSPSPSSLVPGGPPDASAPGAPPPPASPPKSDLEELEGALGITGTPAPADAPGSRSTIEGAQLDVLRAIQAVPYPRGIHVVVQFDHGAGGSGGQRRVARDEDPKGAIRYELVNAGAEQMAAHWREVERLGEVNSGDPATLQSFLDWGAARYPARRYALHLDGHGSGVLTFDGGPGTIGVSRSPRTRSAGEDGSARDALTFEELAEVLTGFGQTHHDGRKLDNLYLINCLAGGLEALHQLRGSVDYVAASPANIAFSSTTHMNPYDHLRAYPTADGESLVKAMVRAFAESTRRMGQGDPIGPSEIVASWRTDRIGAVTEAVSTLARELERAHRHLLTGSREGLVAHRTASIAYGQEYVDLAALCDVITDIRGPVAGVANRPALIEAARRVKDRLEAAILTRTSHGQYREGARRGGLSIYWPSPEMGYPEEVRSYYRRMAFARDSYWDELLDALSPLRDQVGARRATTLPAPLPGQDPAGPGPGTGLFGLSGL